MARKRKYSINLRDLIDGVRTSGTEEGALLNLERYNLLERIRLLEKHMENVRNTINKDIPNAIVNAKNDVKEYADSQVHNAETKLANFTTSKIEETKQNIGSFIEEKTGEVEGIAREAITRAKSATSEAENALAKSSDALEKITLAIQEAKDLGERFTNVADGLKEDLTILQQKAQKFITILKREFLSLALELKNFAVLIRDSSVDIANKAQSLGSELSSTAKNLADPFGNILEYLRRVRDDEKIYIPYNLSVVVSLLISEMAIDIVQNAPFAEERTDMNKGVLEELIKGFFDIRDDALSLKNAISSAGGSLENKGQDLSDHLEHSLNLISTAFNEFINAFYNIPNNMAKRIKGEME